MSSNDKNKKKLKDLDKNTLLLLLGLINGKLDEIVRLLNELNHKRDKQLSSKTTAINATKSNETNKS